MGYINTLHTLKTFAGSNTLCGKNLYTLSGSIHPFIYVASKESACNLMLFLHLTQNKMHSPTYRLVKEFPSLCSALRCCNSLNKNKSLPPLLPPFILCLLFFSPDGGQSSAQVCWCIHFSQVKQLTRYKICVNGQCFLVMSFVSFCQSSSEEEPEVKKLLLLQLVKIGKLWGVLASAF